MIRKGKNTEGTVFKCTTCNFVLRQKKTESPPSYCPSCAIQHLGGEMVPVSEYTPNDQGEKVTPGGLSKTFSENEPERSSS